MKTMIIWVMCALAVSPACRADLQEEFNVLFQKGKYDEAEHLLADKGPASSDPEAAARILGSLREFRSTDPTQEAAFIIHNPTAKTLTYQTRWGTGDWSDSTIEPFKTWRHRSSASRTGEPSQGAPQFRLTNTGADTEPTTYNLKASVVTKGEWEGVRKYFLAPQSSAVTYVVTGIDNDDTLNVRSGPGTDNDIVARLSNGTTGLKITGDKAFNGSDDWVPISFAGGEGWTRPKYLAEAESSAAPLELFNFHDYSDSLGAVKILNDTTNAISFKWRWKNGDDWQKKTLEPNYFSTFTFDYYPGVFVSPAFQIEFDCVAGDDGYTPKNYDLQRNRCQRGHQNDEAMTYHFQYDDPSSLNLYIK